MGRCCSKQITPWHGSSETSGTMSNSSKKIIQEMWIAMKPDSTNFGIAVLIRLFDEAPGTQDLFENYKGVTDHEELLQTLRELDHVARVMSAFGNFIESLHDINKVKDMVQSIGKAHKKTGTNVEHIVTFSKISVDLLADACKSSWTSEKEKAWKDLFALLTEHFAIGLNDENNNHVSS